VNLLSSLLSSLVNQGTAFINGAGLPGAMGNQHPSIAPYETLSTRDGALAVTVGNDRQFETFARALGRPELATDTRFASNAARVANRDALIVALESALQSDSAVGWSERLTRIGIAAGPVNSLDAAFALAARLGLDPIVQFPGRDGGPPVSTLANPLRMSASTIRYDRPPPPLGADSAAVRAWLSTR
jgi:crotonobetainyl-CoA:carnitine CoA-transferase CaiB-like acyl-CoA transferase